MMYVFGREFARALRIRGLSASRVAELARVSPATVGSALHGREVQVATAMRIARAVADAPVIDELEQWGEPPGLD